MAAQPGGPKAVPALPAPAAVASTDDRDWETF